MNHQAETYEPILLTYVLNASIEHCENLHGLRV